jgi:hypothetical protein
VSRRAQAFYSAHTLAEIKRRAAAAAPRSADARGGGEACSICMEPVLAAGGGAAARRRAVALPLCGHAYHEECVFRWLVSR